MSELGYREEGEHIQLTMTRDDFEHLLWLIGIAGATVHVRFNYFEFVDRINLGNPGWRPYTEPLKTP